MIKYSLIIPHFNDPYRLKRLLKTVPVNRPDLQVIVVDDCSTQQSSLELLKTRWPSIFWRYTTENSGAGAARNVGLSNAQGKYLVFADSDDKFLPEAFNIFDEHVKPEDELVYFLAEAVQELDGLPSNRADRMNELCLDYFHNQSLSKVERLKLGHVNPIAKIYSREFVERLNLEFDETRVSNDVAFNVLAAVQAKKIAVVPIPVYRVFRRNGSLTANEDLEKIKLRIRVLADVNKELARLNYSGRMHGGSYLYRGVLRGPRDFLVISREVLYGKLFWPILQRFSIREFIGFIHRNRQHHKEQRGL